MTDLTAATFLVLREAFFEPGPRPRPFLLRDKRNTQDDPLDAHIHQLLSERASPDIYSFPAPGPLITPDLVVLRPELCDGVPRAALRTDPSRIVGIEVKKLERQPGGSVARASGMDYNTTPPCGTVRVYDRFSRALDVKGFYLFVCQEPVEGHAGEYKLTALALCDGDLLNADFSFYLSIVGERTKKTGLGTYRDGADRNRPMLIFVNPLGATLLDNQVTLVHSRPDLEAEVPELRRVGLIRRSVPDALPAAFHCYRVHADVPEEHQAFEADDPFPTPTRTDKTQPRGRFRLEIAPAE
jgi:hypothetical protein